MEELVLFTIPMVVNTEHKENQTTPTGIVILCKSIMSGILNKNASQVTTIRIILGGKVECNEILLFTNNHHRQVGNVTGQLEHC